MGRKDIYLEAKKAGVQYGQPNAPSPLAGGGKTFRNWMSQFFKLEDHEVDDFLNNPKTPATIKKACRLFLEANSFKDMVRAADMVESKPAQVNEVRLSADPLEIAAKIINGEL